jgi:hypothetical protein
MLAGCEPLTPECTPEPPESLPHAQNMDPASKAMNVDATLNMFELLTKNATGKIYQYGNLA